VPLTGGVCRGTDQPAAPHHTPPNSQHVHHPVPRPAPTRTHHRSRKWSPMPGPSESVDDSLPQKGACPCSNSRLRARVSACRWTQSRACRRNVDERRWPRAGRHAIIATTVLCRCCPPLRTASTLGSRHGMSMNRRSPMPLSEAWGASERRATRAGSTRAPPACGARCVDGPRRPTGGCTAGAAGMAGAVAPAGAGGCGSPGTSAMVQALSANPRLPGSFVPQRETEAVYENRFHTNR